MHNLFHFIMATIVGNAQSKHKVVFQAMSCKRLMISLPLCFGTESPEVN